MRAVRQALFTDPRLKHNDWIQFSGLPSIALPLIEWAEAHIAATTATIKALPNVAKQTTKLILAALVVAYDIRR